MVRLAILALATLLASTTAQNTTLRYMPFGDSITEIICWRSKLWNQLQSTPYAATNFVGSGKTENNCKDTKYDRDNEGHSGFLAIDIANKGQLEGWLKANPADVITMHLGTNDIVQQNKAVGDIIAAFGKLITTMRASNPRMKIVVAKIIPIAIGNYNAKIQQLNAAITPWAQGLNKTESPIWVVDQYTGFDAAADLRDGVHPNDKGDEKMVKVWFPAVLRALEEAGKERG
ncbi:SGNH hydrolase-type esterase domain-containing protein [Paraphoma chrysanthemicola]|uniref:SGNH hydrolase-type esterase domain-containing protein n=1 Tax=Paraphoma chrysanthemicola TaxID=798071 RepID=A0A8K0VWW6_9PLEO|nr:SGNH hydrolase-type esterase domain-containing protein [Paraphoma chrysanthemicola]